MSEPYTPDVEVHPDKLRRCEICKHSCICDDYTAENGATVICEKDDHSKTKLFGVLCPEAMTCEHWEWDRHGEDE